MHVARRTATAAAAAVAAAALNNIACHKHSRAPAALDSLQFASNVSEREGSVCIQYLRCHHLENTQHKRRFPYICSTCGGPGSRPFAPAWRCMLPPSRVRFCTTFIQRQHQLDVAGAMPFIMQSNLIAGLRDASAVPAYTAASGFSLALRNEGESDAKGGGDPAMDDSELCGQGR